MAKKLFKTAFRRAPRHRLLRLRTLHHHYLPLACCPPSVRWAHRRRLHQSDAPHGGNFPPAPDLAEHHPDLRPAPFRRSHHLRPFFQSDERNEPEGVQEREVNQDYTTSMPKGDRASFARRKCIFPHGMPMMVMQSNRP